MVVVFPDVTTIRLPLVPTQRGQYLLEDLVIFPAATTVGSSMREE